ncbi:hypothetical protein [Rheinheimera sp.]|uniref:hypothetical protein n=1 Tax=Rheinheimera sp. TaxID=1869214 RepID=UPI0037CC583A
MSDTPLLYTPIHIWLGNFITTEHVAEFNFIRKIAGVHQRFLYPYTRQGRRGFQQLYSVEQQAYCQMLAHKGCIASCMLFGFSLSAAYRDSRRIICIKNAYEYAFLGIEGLLQCSVEDSFLDEVEQYLDSPVFYQICAFLAEKYPQFGGPEHQQHPVIQFCQALTLSPSIASQFH